MRYRLGLDIGSNSIGWCALILGDGGQPCGVLGTGVRVYPDGRNPKDGTSLAVARRGPRSMRRNRDRYLQRRRNLLNALTRYGLMPAEADARRLVASRDPYALRDQALRARLKLDDLGRVLFHLNQHRGFKSNRKADSNNNDRTLIRDAANATRAELSREGCATIGQWLAHRHAAKQPVRVRLAGSGASKSYPFYPTREMVEEEFATIWAAQSGWNPALNGTMRDQISKIIFNQRPLKPVPVGRCWLETGEERAPRALPTAQRFRIAQTLSHLKLTVPGLPERMLSAEERDILASLLYQGRDLDFDRVRKDLHLPVETDFNTREKGLDGCRVAQRFGKKSIAGGIWHTLNLQAQDAAVGIIMDAESDEAAVEALRSLELPEDVAISLAGAGLPDGHASLSALAMGKILPFLQSGRRYDEAVRLAGYRHHSDRRTGEIRTSLPYYGELLFDRLGTGSGEPSDDEEKRFGRAPNPTVHVALNEVRRTVNAIVERFEMAPTEIVVETLRDLGRSKKQREDAEKRNKENRARNDTRRQMLLSMNLPINAGNMARLRLWEEQADDPKNRVCPYTGKLITPVTAVTAQFEEDHILPFASSLDDSSSNRILVAREANRIKAKRTPFEAFGHTPDWVAIAERVRLLPQAKRWRFQPDALAKFAREGDFLARHLSDSATIARWAKEYLEVLAPGKVWTIPGRLTSLLRNALGLNSNSVLGKGGPAKERTDHRHHAIDALVVALTDRGILQRVTRAAKAAEDKAERLIVALDPPWEGFVADAAARIQAVITSHKPDIGWQAALHNDTAYGTISDAKSNEPNVVVRRAIDAMVDWSPDKAREGIRDPVLASKVAATLTIQDKAARKAAISAIRHSGDFVVRRVRTVERLEGVQAVSNRATGKPYKLLKRDSNHNTEIWRLPDGKLQMRVISTFDAATQSEAVRLGRAPPGHRPHPAAKLLMRLHINDSIALGDASNRRILRIVKMSGGRITCAECNEAGSLKKRDEDKLDPFRYSELRLKQFRSESVRKIQITPDGRIRDPGPPR